MKLFKDTRGFVIAFGFDMVKREPNPRMISWCDPATGKWEPGPGIESGYNIMAFDVAPEFAREIEGGVVAYQPGLCVEMRLEPGSVWVWSFKTLQAENT